MKKKFLKFGILTLILIAILAPTNIALAGPVDAVVDAAAWAGKKILDPVVVSLFQGISQLLITLSSLILGLSGKIFDFIVEFTILEMAENLDGGLGDGINTAWATLRDIANIFFIFVLLFTAFKAMFDLNIESLRKTLVDIIIIALLINFSLFLSKIVIDASNVVSIGFYDTIAVSANEQQIGDNVIFTGVSGGYMKMLGVHSLFNADILDMPGVNDPIKILQVGVMSAIFLLVSAIILIISSVMFITRFIILIFIMILSPLAFVAFIVPGMKDYHSQWKDALINQSFFAPIFFALTWVAFKLGFALRAMLMKGQGDFSFTATFKDPGAAIGILVNYVVITGFAIAALIISKTIANKTPGFAQVNKFLGGATIGASAWAGRKTVGKLGQRVADSKWLREKAPDNRLASTALSVGKKTGSASFDLRASKTVGTVLGDGMKGFGKAGGKGGYQSAREASIKRKMEFAEKDLKDNVTGADVEREMKKIGCGIKENQRQKRSASEVEAKRKEVQKSLEKKATSNTKSRQEKYRHRLSQSGVYVNTEAARRMRAGQKTKSESEKIIDLLKEELRKEEKEKEVTTDNKPPATS